MPGTKYTSKAEELMEDPSKESIAEALMEMSNDAFQLKVVMYARELKALLEAEALLEEHGLRGEYRERLKDVWAYADGRALKVFPCKCAREGCKEQRGYDGLCGKHLEERFEEGRNDG